MGREERPCLDNPSSDGPDDHPVANKSTIWDQPPPPLRGPPRAAGPSIFAPPTTAILINVCRTPTEERFGSTRTTRSLLLFRRKVVNFAQFDVGRYNVEVAAALGGSRGCGSGP